MSGLKLHDQRPVSGDAGRIVVGYKKAVIIQMCIRDSHSTIYLLIAGSYTPFCLILLRNTLKGQVIFIALWAAALVGIVLNAISVEKFKYLSLILYVVMGWAAVFAIRDIAAALPTTGFWLLVGGGLSYTGGILFYVDKKRPYAHSVWHLFVLGGSVLHYLCIALYVLPTAFRA